MDLEAVKNFVMTSGMDALTKLIVAILFWAVGRWLISLLMRVVSKAFERGGKVDSTLSMYLTSILSALLSIGLAIGILGFLGVQTTTFGALLAGAGLAIGTAWGGLLAHFAAGAFLQVLRPFKVGDYVIAGGVEGTVREIGLFGTTILTPDNVTTMVGNNKIFSEVVKNYSAQPFRRVDAVAKVANSVNAMEAIEKLRPAIAAIPNVLSSPAPDIAILELTAEGPQLCVRPYCHTDHYWQVWFETNRVIVEVFGAAKYPTPELPVATRSTPH